MGMVDYAYYLNTFGGSRIPEGAFGQVMEEARVILTALLYPTTPENLGVTQGEAYRRALCYEAEYIYDGTLSSSHGAVKSEKLGDYAVEYRTTSERSALSVHGREVSPTAVSLLYGAGLMVRWV